MKKAIHSFILLILLGTAAQAQTYDTIYGRPPHAYLDFWYDTTAWFRNNTKDYCLRLGESSIITYDTARSHYERQFTPNRLRVEGLACMVSMDWTEKCDHSPLCVTDTTPSGKGVYMYLYRDYGYHGLGWGYNSDSVELLACVRWDTATPKVLFLQHRSDPSYGRDSCYLYEVKLDTPVYLDSFYLIGGTTPHYWNETGPRHIECANEPPVLYYGIGADHYSDWITYDPATPWQFGRTWPLSFYFSRETFPPVQDFGYVGGCTAGTRVTFGRFFPMIYSKELRVQSDNDTMGQAMGGGYFSDSTTNIISAVASRGYKFSHWNDGDTNNPRNILLTQDTVFTAYFQALDTLFVTVTTVPEEGGTIEGGGTQFPGPWTLTAHPAEGYVFQHWDDGSTNATRDITLQNDTSVTAYFHKIDSFIVKLQCSPENSATLSIGNRYTSDTLFREIDSMTVICVEGSILTLYCAPKPGYQFSHWNDSIRSRAYDLLPTSDTLITAYLKKTGDGIATPDIPTYRLKLTPNPAHDKVCVQCPDHLPLNNAQMHILDAAGKELLSLPFRTASQTLDVSHLSPGIYFITVSTPDWSASEKLVIE